MSTEQFEQDTERQPLTPEQNYEQLAKKLYYSGFGDALNEQLKAAIFSQKQEFSLEHFATIGEDQMGYQLHFRRDDKTDRVYFNTYDAALLKDSENPDGGIKEHNFGADRNITALEAYRMLKHGDVVAVNKDLYNKEHQPYNVWISIDTSAVKDEKGNYPVNSYHENYYRKHPFDLPAILQAMPVPIKELELPAHRDNIEKALRKASLPEVTMQIGGKVVKGYLAIDPKEGVVRILDQDKQVIEPEKIQELSQTASGDVKKKPWDEKGMKQGTKGPRP